MYKYSIFGNCLASELELPDLRPSAIGQHPRWTLRIAGSATPGHPTAARGHLELGPGFRLTLANTERGIRLDLARVGTLELTGEGTQITWHPAPDASLEIVRMLVLGQVMALSLQGEGLLCLHGSAVAIDRRGIAFLAPKFHGKSTLALALTAAGAQLITDDLVAVEMGDDVRLRPGVQSIRLLEDGLQRMGALCRGTRIVQGEKGTITDFPTPMLAGGSVSFSAAYLLHPLAALPGFDSVRRERLSLSQAALALAYRTKLPDPLVGYQTAATDLQRIAVVAGQVPVYRLEFPADLSRLPDLVDQLLTWHRLPVRPRSVVVNL